MDHAKLVETIKGKLRILVDIFRGWGLGEEDYLLICELAFNLTGVPVVASHIREFLSGGPLPVEVYVDAEKYQGPKVPEEIVGHPYKITLPAKEAFKFAKAHNLSIEHFIILDEKARSASAQVVDLGEGKRIRAMRPLPNLAFFAERTILRYSKDFAGEEKIREWFDKLLQIKKAAESAGHLDLVEACDRYIDQSRKKWGSILER